MLHLFRTSLGVLALAAVTAGPGGGALAANGPFLAHQALYDLSLVKSRSNSINSARGRILYNFSGSACEGYTSEFRQVSELDSGEGKITLSDLRSNSWEDAAGKSYRFKIETRMNEADAGRVDGSAERDGDHINVKLKLPSPKSFTLDQAITEAIDNNLDLAAQKLNIPVAQAREITARLRPNPVLSVSGQTLNLLLGLSHPVDMEVPEGLKVSVENNTRIKIEGIDKQQVGQFAADVRKLRPPEPYKGKGIRYSDEYVRRKVGKTGAAGG